ncbi:hypothetical protein HDU76_013839 [Blyttiomyces sp. JEL0837]|nr:hypothetical protein HDU76_013839 [Blyttiomyces sp. JEL0837]
MGIPGLDSALIEDGREGRAGLSAAVESGAPGVTVDEEEDAVDRESKPESGGEAPAALALPDLSHGFGGDVVCIGVHLISAKPMKQNKFQNSSFFIYFGDVTHAHENPTQNLSRSSNANDLPSGHHSNCWTLKLTAGISTASHRPDGPVHSANASVNFGVSAWVVNASLTMNGSRSFNCVGPRFRTCAIYYFSGICFFENNLDTISF